MKRGTFMTIVESTMFVNNFFFPKDLRRAFNPVELDAETSLINASSSAALTALI
jgi:hypothetical protein